MKIRWKKVFYFVLFLGSLVKSVQVIAQNDAIIRLQNINLTVYKEEFQLEGQVIDSANNYPMPFCEIFLLGANDTSIYIARTDFDGIFSLPKITQGVYSLKIIFPGYDTCQINNILISKNSKFAIINTRSKKRNKKYETLRMCYGYTNEYMPKPKDTSKFKPFNINETPPNYRSRKPKLKP